MQSYLQSSLLIYMKGRNKKRIIVFVEIIIQSNQTIIDNKYLRPLPHKCWITRRKNMKQQDEEINKVK